MVAKLKSANKYLIIQETKEEKKTEGGLIIHPIADNYKKGVVLSGSYSLTGKTVAYNRIIADIEGNHVVHPDAILGVFE